MLKALHARARRSAADRRPRPHRRAEAATPAPRCAPAIRATIRSRRRFCRAPRLNKQGSEKETWHVEFDLIGMRPRLRGRRRLRRFFRSNDPALVDRSSRRSARRPIFRSAASTLREVLIDGVSLVARARHAVPALLLHHRRRAAEEGAGARRPAKIPTATPRRSTCWRRSRNFPACGPIRRPSSRRSIRCSRGSIRSRRRRRSARAASRSPSTRCAMTIGNRSAARRRLDLPRRARRARRHDQGLCAEGAAFGLPADPQRRSSWSAPAPASRRSAPSCRSAWRPGAGPQLAVLRPPAPRLRFLLRGRVRRR